jgi:uncharacterized MnhB-related membrane protein
MTTVLLALIVSLSVFAVFAKDLLHGVFALSAVSIISAIVFVLAKAPDVAITEAAVGAGVSTIIFVWALRHTRRKDEGDS